jgi:hypothetical protein
MQQAIETAGVHVDGRDVAAWWGSPASADPDDPLWQERAAAYVEAHPRSRPSAHARAQRIALLRRLAAGPAERADLLAALRTVGWVGGSDLENRLRELQPGAVRGTQGAPAIVEAEGRFRLAEAFPRLDASSVRSIAFAKAVLERLDGPLAQQALAALDGLMPGVAPHGRPRLSRHHRAGAAALERFDEALEARRPVRVRYFSLNSGLERSYALVPLRYVTVAPVVKALCVPVDATGRRTDRDRQFALDRLIDVEPLPHWPEPSADARRLQRSPIELEVSDGLYQVMVARSLLGIEAAQAEEVDVGAWRVRGSFPTALAWDVMEQLCAWSGNAQVHEPLWLVNAVCRRLRKGLAVMEAGVPFELVKPDPDRAFSSHGEAVSWEPGPHRSGTARRLRPSQGRDDERPRQAP